MTIGELARQAEMTVEAIRYYERRGLLRAASRTPAGYRRYEQDALDRVRFIKRARSLDFSLREIGELLTLRVRPDASCETVDRATERKLRTIRRRIEELTVLERRLARLARTCDATRPIRECPILRELQSANARESSRPV